MSEGLDAVSRHRLIEQMLIVALKRLVAAGQALDFPVEEVDDTGQDMLEMSVTQKGPTGTPVFHFDLRKKS